MIAMPDSQQYPKNLYLIKNVEDIVVFLGLFHFFKFSYEMRKSLCRETTIEYY